MVRAVLRRARTFSAVRLAGRVMGAVRRDRPLISGCSTAARARGQRPRATSVKSISARSFRPRLMSRFRRPTSISTHSTVLPIKASEQATPPVIEVFPVPPFPEVIEITVLMEETS